MSLLNHLTLKERFLSPLSLLPLSPLLIFLTATAGRLATPVWMWNSLAAGAMDIVCLSFHSVWQLQKHSWLSRFKEYLVFLSVPGSEMFSSQHHPLWWFLLHPPSIPILLFVCLLFKFEVSNSRPFTTHFYHDTEHPLNYAKFLKWQLLWR